MSPRYDAEWVAGLLGQERTDLERPDALLEAIGLRRGDVVADVGCGPGFFTLPAARIVGKEGHVHAIDTEAAMLELIEERVEEQGLDNVTAILTMGEQAPLPDGSCDAVICGLVLHHLDVAHRARMAAELARLCKPGGAVLAVEWTPREGESRRDRMAPEETASLLEGAGLRVVETRLLAGLQRPGGHSEGIYEVVARRDG